MDRPGATLAGSDRRLLDELDRGFAEVRERAGEHLLCARGCSDCCHGPFPITRLDVWRLRRGLRQADEPTATAIRSDAREAFETMRPGFPGEIATGRLVGDTAILDRFFKTHASMTCPVLDKSTGACRLWEHRPVACRTYGPPLRFAERSAPHCKLCFVNASTETIDACRWSPDPRELEQSALQVLGVAAGDEWEMLIAHAVGRAR